MLVTNLLTLFLVFQLHQVSAQSSKELPGPAIGKQLGMAVGSVSTTPGPLGLVSPSGDTMAEPSAMAEFCQWETFNASCPAMDQVVLMTSARYGRMKYGRCVREDHGSLGCSADVLPQLDARCSGRRNCLVSVPDPSLHNTHSCPKELMPYLEAAFTCLTVITGLQSSRRSCPTIITQPVGYLSALAAVDTGVGFESCPWTIHVESGLRVNVSLFNFVDANAAGATQFGRGAGTMQRARGQSSQSSAGGGAGDCSSEWTVVIREGNITAEVPMCNSGSNGRSVVTSSATSVGPDSWLISREKVIYTSRGGAPVLVYLISGSTSTESESMTHARSTQLLMRYQIFGCPDLKPISYGTISRHGDTSVVKCTSSGLTSVLTCVDGHWVGQVANCTAIRAKALESSSKDSRVGILPQGLLLVVGIGVVMGVAMGAVMLLAIIVCLRRRRQILNTRSQTTDPLLQKTDSACVGSGTGGLDQLAVECRYAAQGHHDGVVPWTADQLSVCPFHQQVYHHHHHHVHHPRGQSRSLHQLYQSAAELQQTSPSSPAAVCADDDPNTCLGCLSTPSSVSCGLLRHHQMVPCSPADAPSLTSSSICQLLSTPAAVISSATLCSRHRVQNAEVTGDDIDASTLMMTSHPGSVGSPTKTITGFGNGDNNELDLIRTTTTLPTSYSSNFPAGGNGTWKSGFTSHRPTNRDFGTISGWMDAGKCHCVQGHAVDPASHQSTSLSIVQSAL